MLPVRCYTCRFIVPEVYELVNFSFAETFLGIKTLCLCSIASDRGGPRFELNSSCMRTPRETQTAVLYTPAVAMIQTLATERGSSSSARLSSRALARKIKEQRCLHQQLQIQLKEYPYNKTKTTHILEKCGCFHPCNQYSSL